MLLTASPRAAGSLLVIYEGVRDRHAARARQVAEDALAGVDADVAARRLAGDEMLDALLAAAIETGARTGVERQATPSRRSSWRRPPEPQPNQPRVSSSRQERNRR